MMIKDCKSLIELQYIHMDKSSEKACKTKFLKCKSDLKNDYTNENKTEHNFKWPYIPEILHPYRKLIIGGSISGKTNAILHLINNQSDVDKMSLYGKDPYEGKYQYLINKREQVGLKHYNDPKNFIEYSNDMQDVYKNLEEKLKVIIVFDDMIADMINNKKLKKTISD